MPKTRGDAAPLVSALLARVESFALSEWLAIAASPGEDSRYAASAIACDAMLARHALELEAWRLRDAVETLAWLALRRCGAPTARECAALTCARDRIARAACAALAADHLPATELETLLAPVAPYAPLAIRRRRAPGRGAA